jgi:cell division protein FtsI/penicillin-binding protein 2
VLPRRAIGYGVQASPLHVARAYAALATGWLPTLGLRVGARPRVPLDDVTGEIVTTRKGLRACIEHGTASKRGLEVLDELGVCGKTGTAEVGIRDGENNAWFAGYLPDRGEPQVQLCCCAVVYWVRDQVHGAEAAGSLVADFLRAVRDDPELAARYLAPGGGR